MIFSVSVIIKANAFSSQIHSPLLGDIVDSGLGLSYRPACLCSLAGRYDSPMPESTLSPQSRTMDLATHNVEGIINWKASNLAVTWWEILYRGVRVEYHALTLSIVSKVTAVICPQRARLTESMANHQRALLALLLEKINGFAVLRHEPRQGLSQKFKFK